MVGCVGHVCLGFGRTKRWLRATPEARALELAFIDDWLENAPLHAPHAGVAPEMRPARLT